MDELWRRIYFCSILLVILSGIIDAKTNKNLVTEFVKSSGSTIFDTKEHTQFAVLIESKESEDYDDYLDEFNKAAKKFEDKVRFVYINSDVEENWQVIEFLGLIAEDVPGVLYIDLEKGLKKYKAEMKEITKAEIISFVQSCLDGTATAFLKSDEISENWDKGPVVELVGKNFEKQVFGTEKSTFVFFYAPWCSACQITLPEVEKLGELYKDKKNVVIAKMDSINNEVPSLPIFDVPTLALFVEGSRKPVYYTDDDRTVNDFSQFISTNLKEAKSEDEESEKITEKKSKKEKSSSSSKEAAADADAAEKKDKKSKEDRKGKDGSNKKEGDKKKKSKSSKKDEL